VNAKQAPEVLMKQRGVTMLSLMIGMAISLIATVGLLTVYHDALQVTVHTQAHTTTDGQLASVLMRTAASTADAGYGISTPTYGTHFVVLTGANLNAGTLTGTLATVPVIAGNTANAVVWATMNGATMQCAGFYAPTIGGLEYLNPTPCTNASAWGTLAWVATPVTSQASISVIFLIAAQSCAPYGITNTQGSYLFTVQSNNSLGNPVYSQQCLLNFQ